MRAEALIFAAAGLAALACGSPGASAGSPPAGASSPSASAGRGTAVAGRLSQLSGVRLLLNGQNGQFTVTYDRSTRFQRTDPGSPSDITIGACINATGASGPGGVTASIVQVSASVNGACGTGNAGSGGPGQGRFPNGGNVGNGGAANFGAVRGKVTAVSGSSVTVQPTSGTDVTLTVPATASISKTEPATSKQLAVGQCIAAVGQVDSSGAVKARSVTITPAGPDGCTFGGFGPRGRPTPGVTSP